MGVSRGNLGGVVHRHLKMACATASVLALSLASTQAQDAPRSTTLEPIVVTGSKASEAKGTHAIGSPPPAYAGSQVATGARLGALGNRSITKTPFSATSFTADLIRNQQARTVADITSNDPSVRSDAPAYSERDSFFIRGFSVTNVDTLYDGLPYLANPRRAPLEGIERVEILKGPSLLVNGGTGRVGGAINLIPKRASDEPLTRLTTTYVSDSQFWNHIDLGRRAGPNGEWGMRVNGSYRFGDTPLDHSDIKVGNLAVGLDYRGERLRASVDINHASQKIDAPASLFNTAAPNIVIPEAPKGDVNTSNPFEYHDSRNNMIASRIEYDVVDGTTIYIAGGASRYREDFLSTEYRITDANGNGDSFFGYNPQQITGYSGEIGLRSAFDTGEIGHEFSLSASKSISENNRGRFNPRTLGFPTYRTNIYDPTFLPDGSVSTQGLPRSNDLHPFADLTTTGIAIADTMSFADGFVELTVGGRYQKIRTRGFNTRPGNPAAPVGTRNFLAEDSHFSPGVGAMIKLTEQFSVYGNYVEALTEGPTAPGTAINSGEQFQAVVNRQKEIGVKYDLGDVLLTAALFEIRQPNAFTDPATRLFSVSGKQVNRGLELAAFGEPIDGLRLLGGVTFLDAELAKTAGGLLDGNDVPGVPTTTISLYGEYDTPWVENFTLTGRVLHNSSTKYDQANKQKISDWTRLDLGARYKFTRENGKPIELKANVENVLNENYWASSARGFLATGAPRTFMLSASFDF
jgi:iron complex outermembrane receptor protein